MEVFNTQPGAADNAAALITDNIDIWTSAIKARATQGRGSSKKRELYGIKKLRELILELAVRGKLVPQDANDEPASTLLKRIAAEKAVLVKEGKLKKQKTLPTVSGDEVAGGIPAGWIWTRLGEIAEIGPRNGEIADDADVSFVPMSLISKSYKGDHGSEDRTWSEVKKGYTHFADGDIAVAKITPCFENSKAAIFRGLKNGVGTGTTELHVARPIGNTIDRLYILLYLKAPQFLIIGETKMTGTAGQKRVPKEFFAGNPLPLPPLSEQHRIVAKVDELMALCDQLEQQTEASIDAHATLVENLLAALTQSADATELEQNWTRIADHFDTLFTTDHSIDQLKQCVLQLAVMGKLVPQDPNDEPAAVLLEKIAAEKTQLVKEKKIKKHKALPPIGDEEKPFALPEGWEWCRLGSLTSVVTSGSRGWNKYYSDTGATFIRSQDIKYDRLEFDNRAFVDLPRSTEGKRTKVDLDDILITITGANVGKAARIEAVLDEAYVSQHVSLIKLIDGSLATYLHLWLTGGHGGRKELLSQSYGDKPGLNLQNINELPVPVAPALHQKVVLAKVDQLLALCDQLKARLQQAQQTQLHLADALVVQAVG